METEIQSEQYEFPYHHIPHNGSKRYLSRHWRFAPSYIAALELVTAELRPYAQERGPGYRHVDLGCGDGALIHYLSRMSGFEETQIDGADFDAHAVEWARMFNRTHDIYACDLADLEREHYNSATLVEVAEHIPPDELLKFLGNVARLLRPGGHLVVTVPSVEKPVAPKHFQHFAFDTIRPLLEPYFDTIKIRGFERMDWMTRFVDKVRFNRLARIDAPLLNRLAIARLRRLHKRQPGCGRLFVTCRRK